MTSKVIKWPLMTLANYKHELFLLSQLNECKADCLKTMCLTSLYTKL